MTPTQIYLGEHERKLLAQASEKTGASQSELIRRAIRAAYHLELTREEKVAAMKRAAGIWEDRNFTGAEYVDAIRGKGIGDGLRSLGLVD